MAEAERAFDTVAANAVCTFEATEERIAYRGAIPALPRR
jgi:hypothetical protein